MHGHIFDLIRILSINGLPPDTQYLFLGDIVDRGEFNIEMITLIYLMKILFPDDVYIIRGNHEFEDIVDHTHVQSEMRALYGNDDLIKKLYKTFTYMSIGAKIDDDYAFCVHGGICQNFFFISQLEEIPKPVEQVTTYPIILGVVWSDPYENVEEYCSSDRGLGEHFGIKPLNNFLQKNGIFMIIRGHQVVDKGVVSAMNHRITTVFSASSYCGENENMSGIIKFVSEARYEPATYPPLPYAKRIEVGLLPLEMFDKLQKKALGKRKSLGGIPNTPLGSLQSIPSRNAMIGCSNSSSPSLNRDPITRPKVNRNQLPHLELNEKPKVTTRHVRSNSSIENNLFLNTRLTTRNVVSTAGNIQSKASANRKLIPSAIPTAMTARQPEKAPTVYRSARK
ncbi:Ser/Thr protein phosphatase [Tritrichomonas foetus]|uniref:Serine/threonine-protein phosphatase n=1 Tax=Tritrichomonas foetus TaxID=1144522 RepID=A0A1J4KT37_9EUKA|nr:Ser/Thr protein phosphatase [Tritrichomonas foetus]|eukprot:OHT14457.1 Ser/Thr protein phosphatase [Tritrichomonas foetus]